MLAEGSSLVPMVAAALGGGGLVKLIDLVFAERRQSRKEKKAEEKEQLTEDKTLIKLIVDEVAKQRDDALKEVHALRQRIEHLEFTVQGLRMAQNRDPFPRWIVDLSGRFQFVNDCFVEQFLRPKGLHAQDIIGLSHEDFWSSSTICEKIKLLDAEARRRPDGKAKATLEYDGCQLTIYKIPIRHSSGAILAYEGWITDIEQ